MSTHDKGYFTRKIQKFSKYSYAVTLPSNWIKKYDIEQPDGSRTKTWKEEVDPVVNIYEMPDGHLELYLEQQEPADAD